MFSSTNENNGFSAIGADELEVVNGGEPVAIAVVVGFGIGMGVGAAIGHVQKHGK